MDDPYIAAFIIISMFVTTVICMAIGSLFRWALKKSKRIGNGIHD